MEDYQQRVVDEKQALNEKQAELAEEFDQIHTVQRAQEVGSLDGIIPPRDMRRVLIAALERALIEPLGNPPIDQDKA